MSLAEMHEALRHSHKERQRWVLVVVARQLAELAGEPSVVRAGANDAGEAGSLRTSSLPSWLSRPRTSVTLSLGLEMCSIAFPPDKP